MNKGILIYKNKNELKPIGGPTGYLFNLHEALKKSNVEYINFLEQNDINKFRNKLKKKMPVNLKKALFHKYLFDLVHKNKAGAKEDFNEYGAIHFHSTIDLYKNRNNLLNFNGKVILTSHCPKPQHLEIIEDTLSDFEKKIYSTNKIKKLEKIDEYAFNRADYIFFPCEEAEEPYFNNWMKYKEIREKKMQSYRYITSGTVQRMPKRPKEEIYKSYSIPNDSFVISYVGRHNQTKGYDILKELGNEILSRYTNIVFIIAGVEEPLKGLNHERWIEVGWTNDPDSIIAASDMFILPNKETYFDLIMLEVLSLGKIVLASNTGGNKYFKKFESSGIYNFSTKEEAVSQIEEIINYSKQVREQLEKLNFEIYNSNFTTDVFLQKYLLLINEILHKK